MTFLPASVFTPAANCAMSMITRHGLSRVHPTEHASYVFRYGTRRRPANDNR